MVERVEIPAEEAVAGDWVVYISNAKPAGQVSRKVVGKVRDGTKWAIRVAWGVDKTEVIPSTRVKTCLREMEVHQRVEQAKAREQDFRSKLLEGLGIRRG